MALATVAVAGAQRATPPSADACEIAGPPTVVAPAGQRFYRPELDLLRLLAFAMVWTSHALIPLRAFLPGVSLTLLEGAGACGVPVFFFLSAYLITELLRRERARTGHVRLGAFYGRRMLRIWPLYFGLLGAYAVLGLWFHGFRIERGRLLASALLAGNWYIVMHPAITTPLRALWSISVEEQWYLAAPLVERVSALRAQSAKVLLSGCGGIAVCAFATVLVVHSRTAQEFQHVTLWVNSFVQFQYLAMGAAAALVLNGDIPTLPGAARLLLVLAGCVAILCAAGPCGIRSAAAHHALAALLVGYPLAGVGATTLFFAFLGIRVARVPAIFVRLGQLTFGLYMLHETGFFFADACVRHVHLAPSLGAEVCSRLLALAFTVILAWLSYHVWERPFLRLKDRWAVVHSGSDHSGSIHSGSVRSGARA